MTNAEIQQLAASAGFPNPALAAAIAMAESSGNPRAYNGRGGDDSYGLWQINMQGALGPARRSQFGLSSNEQLYDPATNARAAFAISGGGSNFSPWTTYTTGAYKKYLSAGGGAGSSSAGGGGVQLPGLPATIATPFGEGPTIYLVGGLLAYLLLK